MKFTPLLAASLVGFVAASPAPAPMEKRHYTFPSVQSTSDWQYVRQTLNWQSNAGLSDVTSKQLTCYQSGVQGAKNVMTVAAGSSVTFKANPNIFHPGPLQFYMARVPASSDVTTFDGSGAVWFKTYAEKATLANSALSWPSLNKATVSAPIPANLPAGDYLLRIEHIALHQASQVNGAQLYISCAQVRVTGGGSGTPSPLVSLPGAYKATDPGLQVNIYYTQQQYTPPGPAVWSG